MKTKKKSYAITAFLSGTVLFLVALLNAPKIQAAGDAWESVGDNQYLSDQSRGYPSIAFHPTTNDPYVAVVENANSIQVKHFNGTAWENIGSAVTSGELDDARIAFNPSNEELYLSYWDIDLYKVVVVRYSGGSWVDVGPHGMANGSDASLAFKPDTGTPYLAYSDQDAGKLVVKMFNGSAWENVGSFGISSGNVRHISLAFNPSTKEPYVAFEDAGNSEKLGVLKYNGSAWENVGPAGVSSGEATDIEIAFDESTNLPYVVYSDGTAGNALKVKKFDGSSWQDVGDPMGSDLYSMFGQIAFCPSTNVPHVAYVNGDVVKNLVIKKYNGSGWELVGESGFNTYEAISPVDLGFSPATNEPFVVSEDMNPDSTDLYHLGVYKFNKAVSNRPSVNYAKKKKTKRNIVFTFRDLKITTKKSWVKVWLGAKKVKTKAVKRSGDNLRVTLQVNYGKWARGNYNLRMTFKKKVHGHYETDSWRSKNALTIL